MTAACEMCQTTKRLMPCPNHWNLWDMPYLPSSMEISPSTLVSHTKGHHETWPMSRGVKTLCNEFCGEFNAVLMLWVICTFHQCELMRWEHINHWFLYTLPQNLIDFLPFFAIKVTHLYLGHTIYFSLAYENSAAAFYRSMPCSKARPLDLHFSH